jgi:acetamidase/formamidase
MSLSSSRWLSSVVLIGTATLLAGPAHHHVRSVPENMVFGYLAAETAPVLRVASGDIVTIDTVSMGGVKDDPEGFFRMNRIPLDLPVVQEIIAIRREVKPTGINGHMLVRPIYVEGAQPGDTLEVRVIDVRSRAPYGINSGRPGASGIADIVPRPYLRVIPLDLDRQVALFADGIEVPLHPFQGVMAVAPPLERGRLSSTPPYPDLGGNLDNKHLVKGATLYIPVHVPGALFHTGDPHAAQGNGEISITALESSNTVTVQLIVHRGRGLKVVRAETPTHYILMGFDVDLDAAMRMAITETLAFLRSDLGLDSFSALSLGSIAVDFEVTQVVDGTLGIHSMVPKVIFTKQTREYWFSATTAR